MKLIIAEKPSLGVKIIKAIGGRFNSHDGYSENSDYIVTWGFGHLFGLLDLDQYDPDYDPEEKHYWTMDNIPFYPKEFKFGLKADGPGQAKGGIRKQFNTIKTLVHRSDVDTVINAGDSDREGEIIVRIILAHANNKKPVKRLWLPNQTEETIRNALKTADDDKNYDNLANEGMARTYIDWLYGINLTRYCTLKGGKLLRVGRVISEIVNAIYERDMSIENFVPRHYIVPTSNEKTKDIEIKLSSKKEFEPDKQNDALALCDLYNKTGAKVSNIETKKEKIAPGKLYSLSKLQGVLGKKYKMSIDDALSTVQSLYEAGYVTYPRTNTEYLAVAEKDNIKRILTILSSDYPVKFKDSKSIFDDSKIESHSALTPTTKIPDLNTLSSKEKQVYETILNRFVAVFCSEDCLVNRTKIIIDVGEYESFEVTGDIMLQKGWTAFDTYSKKDKVLPELSIGDNVNINFVPDAKESKPPSHFTTTSLLEYLKHPFKKEKKDADENDDEDYKALLDGLEIGTEATRATIITNAIKSGYIMRKGDTYYIEPLGKYYVETLKALNVSMDKTKTVEINRAIKKVYKNELSINDSVQLAINEIDSVFQKKDEVVINSERAEELTSIGSCPLCGKPIKKIKAGYGCSGYKDGCRFAIFSPIAGKKITDKQASDLLNNGKTGKIKGFTSKSGKKFDASLKLEDGKVVFDFNEPPKAEDVSVNCPICNAKLKNDKWAWVCSDECGFKINHQIAGKNLTEKDVVSLIQKGKTGKIKGFVSKSGKKFEASLQLIDGKISFSFD